MFCILSWRVFWLTMLNRVEPDLEPALVLTELETNILDHLIPNPTADPSPARTLSLYLIKISRLGGYLARAKEPPPGNTDAMQAHLEEISRAEAPKSHAMMLMDSAGWHTSGQLDMPENITVVLLPSRAPELNPVENVWQYLRQTYLSNRVFADHAEIIDAACKRLPRL